MQTDEDGSIRRACPYVRTPTPRCGEERRALPSDSRRDLVAHAELLQRRRSFYRRTGPSCGPSSSRIDLALTPSWASGDAAPAAAMSILRSRGEGDGDTRCAVRASQPTNSARTRALRRAARREDALRVLRPRQRLLRHRGRPRANAVKQGAKSPRFRASDFKPCMTALS